jgi:uncharacterized membrane protein
MGEKILCLIAYVLSLPGALFVRLAGSKNKFCLHHARRSLELSFFMLSLLLAWYVIKAILLLIPYVGFPLSMMLFGIIVAAGVFSLVLCIIGIAKAFRKKTVVFPFITSIMSGIEPLFNFIGLPGE